MNVARDLALALDPALLGEVIALELDPWQRAVLRSDAGRILLLCARQTGKSAVAALLALHGALYRPGFLALLLSPSLRQSGELFRQVAGFYGSLQEPVESEAESALRLELANGSRIVSLPGKEQTVRGYSGVDLLVVDEAARVSDELYYSIRPMLAVSGGRMLALSTPWGKRGWFYKSWIGGGNWERVMVRVTECPRISPEFLAEERASLPAWVYNQEYLCEFEDIEGQLFPTELIRRALSSDVKPLFET